MSSAFGRAQRRATYYRLKVPRSLQSSGHKVPRTKLRNQLTRSYVDSCGFPEE